MDHVPFFSTLWTFFRGKPHAGNGRHELGTQQAAKMLRCAVTPMHGPRGDKEGLRVRLERCPWNKFQEDGGRPVTTKESSGNVHVPFLRRDWRSSWRRATSWRRAHEAQTRVAQTSACALQILSVAPKRKRQEGLPDTSVVLATDGPFVTMDYLENPLTMGRSSTAPARRDE